jgi:preprotein translocase subunit YajC
VLLSLGLTVPCAAVYLFVMIRRERKKQEDAK